MPWNVASVTRNGEASRTDGGGQCPEAPQEGKVRARPGLCCLLGKSTHSVLQALTFIIFICFTASISAYMAAALLEFFITLAFLFLYATQYHQCFDRLNWPCLVRAPASPTPFWSLSSPLDSEVPFPLPASLLFLGSAGGLAPNPSRASPQVVPCTQKLLGPTSIHSCQVPDNGEAHPSDLLPHSPKVQPQLQQCPLASAAEPGSTPPQAPGRLS